MCTHISVEQNEALFPSANDDGFRIRKSIDARDRVKVGMESNIGLAFATFSLSTVTKKTARRIPHDRCTTRGCIICKRADKHILFLTPSLRLASLHSPRI